MIQQPHHCDTAKNFLGDPASLPVSDLLKHIALCQTCEHFFESHGSAFSKTIDELTQQDELESLMVQSIQNKNGPKIGPNEPTSTQEPWLIPEIEGFEVLRILANTRSSRVFLARQKSLERLVVLKFVGSGPVAANQKAFARESAVLASLKHPNILGIIETGLWDKGTWLALEYCQEGNLSDWLDRVGKLTPDQSVKLVSKVARAAHAAHEQGIIHRDIKPQNILIDDMGEPRLADFGLSELSGQVSETGGLKSITGTAGYMAPEQLNSSKCDRRVDIHALGAVLYELIVGKPPFEGTDTYATLLSVAHQEPVSPTELDPMIPADLSAIALKSLAKDPGNRYQTAEALARDLDRYSKGQPVTAREISGFEKLIRLGRQNPITTVAVCLAFIGLLSTNLLLWRIAVDGGNYSARLRELVGTLGEKNSELENLAYCSDMRLANTFWQEGDGESLARTLEGHKNRDNSSPDWEWAFLKGQVRTDEVRIKVQGVLQWTLDSAGEIVAASRDGVVARLFRDGRKEILHTWDAEPDGKFVISPGGSWSAFLGRGVIRVACLENPKIGVASHPVSIEPENVQLWIGPDGRNILLYRKDSGRLDLFRPGNAEGRPVWQGALNIRQKPLFSPSENRFAWLDRDGNLRIVDLDGPVAGIGVGSFGLSQPEGKFRRIAWARNGRHLAAMRVRDGKWNQVDLFSSSEKLVRDFPKPRGFGDGHLAPVDENHVWLLEESGNSFVLGNESSGSRPRAISVPYPIDTAITLDQSHGVVQDSNGFWIGPIGDKKNPGQLLERNCGYTPRGIAWFDDIKLAVMPLVNANNLPSHPTFAVNLNTETEIPVEAGQPRMEIAWPSRLGPGSRITSGPDGIRVLNGESQPVLEVAVEPKLLSSAGGWIAFTTKAGKLFRYDMAGNYIELESPKDIRSLQVTADGTIWSINMKGELRLHHLPGAGDPNPFRTVVLNANQKPTCLAPGRNGGVFVGTWDGMVLELAVDGSELSRMIFKSCPVSCLDVSPRYTRVFVGQFDNMVRVADVLSGRSVFEFQRFNSVPIAVSLSPSTRKLAIALTNGSIFVAQ